MSLASQKLLNGRFSTSDEETLKCLTKAHFSSFTEWIEEGLIQKEDMEASGGRLRARIWHQNRKLANRIVTPERIKWAINSFKSYKSPGPNEIYPAHLKKADNVLVGPLVKVTKASLMLGHVPAAWQGARFIPKPGKSGYTSATDFRPISLTSFLLKTSERLVDRYVRDVTLIGKTLHTGQHAYRAGMFTETALQKVTQLIQPQLDNGGFAVGTSMNIGSFNHTSRSVISDALRRFGMPIMLVDWTSHMLGNRQLEVTKRQHHGKGRCVLGLSARGSHVAPAMVSGSRQFVNKPK